MASAIVAIFTGLYPNVMVSSTNAAYNLTAQNTASPAYPLKIMSVVAIILLPVVLIYQAWTYYVFRRRVSARAFEPQAPPPAPAAAPPGTPSPPVGKTAG
jgi:cytochrome d ubiquinol oxidase subunit II